jgi:hypothetical protein
VEQERMENRVGALGPFTLAVLFGLCAASVAAADDADPPGRAARLSYLEGPVSFEPAGLDEWTSAELNRPLTTGDRLWTDEGGVAELDAGPVVIRMGGTTGFSFINLDDHTVQMQLTAGTLIVHVSDMGDQESYEVDTPNLALSLQQPGEYRLEVNDSGDATVVKVTDGLAVAMSGAQSVPVQTQQVMMFTGSAQAGAQLAMSAGALGPPDDLDSWSATRDQQAEESPSRQYVADDVPGSQDLDDNGRWQDTPDYGYVWTPVVVPVGWVPYRFGQWLWVPPWGWTWVDQAPWGYAPFHYGRWTLLNGAWCWVPGPRGARPVYSPALVGWTGQSGGANVGWFPLGPRELYMPPYPVSDAYLRNVNTTNTTIANSAGITYAAQSRVTNQRYVNHTTAGVTQVPQSVFTSAQQVAGHNPRLTAGAVATLAVAAAAPAIVPAKPSVLGAGPSRTAHPPAALFNRPVVAHTLPPRPPPTFTAELSALRANGGRPLARSQLEKLESRPAVPVRMVAAGATAHGALSAKHAGPQTRPMQPAAGPSGTASPSLVEREHALEVKSLPTASRTTSYNPIYSGGSTPSELISQVRSDRPPSIPQRTYASDDPTHARTAPIYRPEYPAPTAAPRAESAERVVSHARRTPARYAPPPKAQSSSHSTREESPRADRSRERITR